MGRKKNFERQDVLEKSLQVFWKKGFADTSVQDLEKATGVNKSGLYSEFKDKEDLYNCTLRPYLEKASAETMFEMEPLGWGNIEKFLKLSITCGTSHENKGCFATYSIREAKILTPQARALLTQNLGRMKSALVKNLKDLTKAKPEVVADMILAFHNGNALEHNLHTPENLKERVDLFLAAIKKM